MNPSVTCYASALKAKSRLICEAFATGCGGDLRVGPYRIDGGLAVFYGVQEDTKGAFDAARLGGEWLYIDNGYFGQGRYFRATRNALQFTGTGPGDMDRFRAFGLEVKPWRRSGGHVLVCPPGDHFMAITGQPMTAGEWLAETLEALTHATDRRIRVRHKQRAKGATPLAADLVDCWAVVTHLSNVAVEAVLAGVPAFTATTSAASPMTLDDPALIEAPYLPDGRADWAGRLAANQWTLEEMRSGRCWRDLLAREDGR